MLVRTPGRPYGLVSERDLVTALATGQDPWSSQAADVMTTDLITAAPADSIAEVGARMLDAGVRHIVLQEGGEVVGIVSIRDVLHALLTQPAAQPAPIRSGG